MVNRTLKSKSTWHVASSRLFVRGTDCLRGSSLVRSGIQHLQTKGTAQIVRTRYFEVLSAANVAGKYPFDCPYVN